LSLPSKRGRGNAGRLMHPQPPTPKNKQTGAVFTDTPEHPALRTQWVYSCFVLFPVNRAFLPPSPCGLTAMSAPGRADVASARLDTSVEVPEPHDLAVRSIRLRQKASPGLSAVRQLAADVSRAASPALPSRVVPDAAASTASPPAFVTFAKHPFTGRDEIHIG